jgi:cysteinyl-tRNA synthetase
MLQVFNTLTRKVEVFKTREKGKVKMFTCGPSIYRRPHIGNYRTFLYEDLLQRYLEYLGYDVVRLISITDVEDKAIEEAEREQVSVKELAERNRAIFSADSELLKMKRPTYSACMMVCSSTAVETAGQLIGTLIERGYAYHYEHMGRWNVYFDPLQFDGFGKLSQLDMSSWPTRKRRFHKDTYPGTPWNRGDFILWHGYRNGDANYWETEIGRGRPAWNVQDAANIVKYMGFSVDVACGGVDNLIRHHDYTIAILEGVSGKQFANCWLHGEHLLVDGSKMSKSKGNVYYPGDLAAKGYSGEHLRFFLIHEHYRKRLNFTLEKLKSTSQTLDHLRKMIHRLNGAKSKNPSPTASEQVETLTTAFEEKMNNDLNVGAAVEELVSRVTVLDNLNQRGELGDQDARNAIVKLRRIDAVLQVMF